MKKVHLKMCPGLHYFELKHVTKPLNCFYKKQHTFNGLLSFLSTRQTSVCQCSTIICAVDEHNILNSFRFSKMLVYLARNVKEMQSESRVTV